MATMIPNPTIADNALFRDTRHSCANPDCSQLTTQPYCCLTCQYVVEGFAWLASLADWEHAAADMPSLDGAYVEAHTTHPTHYVACDGSRTLLGHMNIADVKRLEEEAAGGLAALVCRYGK